jgi:hypothetical protein
MLLVQAQAIPSQYGYNAIFLLPVNFMAGDNFNPNHRMSSGVKSQVYRSAGKRTK